MGLRRITPPALLLASMLLASPARALEGRVIDSEGKPVANAEVSILGLPGVAFTDADGQFSWKPDPQPPFEVLVVLPGGRFMRPVLVERLGGDGPLTITVTPLADEAITVVGSAPSIESTPVAGTTTLSGREIVERSGTNLTQTLESIAGVSVVSEGQAAVPAVRGLARGRTLILIDGARVSSERRVGPSATFLDPMSLDSVEVSRGPGSVAYGSDAFGGVIYARTRRVEPNAPWRAKVAASLGAGVPELQGAAEVSKGSAKGGVLAMAHYREADDYRSPEGDVLNASWRNQGFLIKGDHTLGGGLFSAGWQSDFGRDIGRPRTNSKTVRFYYPIEDSHRFTTSYEVNKAWVFDHVDVTGFLGSYANITDQDRYPTATTPRSIERADVSARDFQTRGKAERLVGPGKLSFGLDVSGRYDLHALDTIIRYDMAGQVAQTTEYVSVDSARRADTGAFVSLDVPLATRVAFSGGLRGDYVTTRNEGGYFGDHSTSNGAFSGFVSLTAAIAAGFNLTGQVSRGFRDPTLSDRYYRGPTGRGFITGNPDLEPETSLQFDVGLRRTTGRVRWAFYVFEYHIHDLIERYEAAADFFFFRNRGEARIRGAEIEVQADLGGGFSTELTGQLQRGRALDDDEWLDDMSPDTVAASLRREFGERGHVQGRVDVYARDDRTGPTEQVVGAHTLVDVSAGLRLHRQLELRASLANLLDQSYLLSPDTRAVLAPGVSLVVNLLAAF
jgi:hemoglobin/transferrin/lactoferrin receptor protein